MISDILRRSVQKSLDKLGLEAPEVNFEHPADLSMGDYSTNIAMALSKKEKQNPKELAPKIVENLEKPKEVEKIEAVNGFINFHLNKDFFADSLKSATKNDFGKNESLKGKKIILEYTDPNPFKLFHIGHLMSNTIGESLARLADYTGAEVKRVNYQGDVGLHVAITIWGLRKENLDPRNIHDLGRAYALGNKAYVVGDNDKKGNQSIRKEVDEINRKLYERSDKELNDLYDKGRKVSLEHFEEQYKKLGTKFDHYFFESETGGFGKEIVEKNKDLFEQSNGAVVFKGEKYGLHTRVFINSQGLPTYEAKELGLAKLKYEKFKYDESYIITGNEINDYFKVLIQAMKLVYKNEELGEKTTHIGHGMLRLPEGKMSSRTGDVILAENLINEAKEKVLDVMAEREIENREEVSEMIAIAAIKYSILKQGIGRDIIFDFDKAVSFEGDSGPYLQYSYVRAKSVLDIAGQKGIEPSDKMSSSWEPSDLEKIIYRFPEVAKRAWEEKGPQLVAKYLIDLAGAFNSFYAKEKIAEEGGEYKLLITKAVANVLKNGLWLLGIKIPDKM